MKSYSFLVVALFFCCSFGFGHTVALTSLELKEGLSTPPRWEKLGQRRVNYGLDRDEILVTAREGVFTAIRLKAELAPINVHRCVVHFANGETKSVNITQNLRAGQITRSINLPGNRRVITKVVFWYDTRDRANRRGRIELWGRN